MPTRQKITTFLWFDGNAEQAIEHYTAIFPNSRLVSATRNGPGGPGPAGSLLVGSFELDGQTFSALNGGPMFRFNEAISLVVHCDDQAEVDHYWSRLGEGGTPGRCGWLKDRFGLSWQVVPDALVRCLQHDDPVKAGRAMAAMMTMGKIDIAALEAAHHG